LLIDTLVSKPPATVVDRELRLVISGIFFLMRLGSPLRESPPWSTAESYFWRWHADGTWAKIMA
jgi:transposase